MKKTLLLLASAALLLVGCAKERFAEPGDGGLTNVTFSVSVDGGVATRALADNDGKGAKVNRCIMEIYFNDVLYTRLEQPVTAASEASKAFATFANVPVVAGKEYQVLFWADHVDVVNTEAGLATDKYYTTKTTTGNKGLKAVTVKKADFIDALKNKKNDELDAFFGADKYTVGQTTNNNFNITLYRPFAQLNVITTDVAAGKTVTSADLLPEKVSVSYKAADVFNVATGAISNSGEEEYTYTYEAGVYGTWSDTKSELTLSMDYILASTEQAAVDVTFITKNSGQAVMTHSLTNLPYKRNYRTNVKGDLLTVGGTWKAEIAPAWTDEITHPVVIATTLEEAQAAIGPASGGEAASTVIVKPEAVTNRDQSKDKTSGQVIITTPGIALPEGAKAIEFVLTPQSQKDVTFELPALPSGNFYWYIRHEEGYPTENLNIKVDSNDATRVIVDAPDDTHVVLNDVVYAHVVAITGENTLVVPQGITVQKLSVKKGGVEIHGEVGELEITGTEEEVFFRSCEGLSEDVFKKIYSETEPVCNYIDPWYTYEKVDNVYNIKKLPIVATIGEENYKSLEEAIAAVENGQTIKIVDNVPTAGGISVPSDKNFTVDFGGHTYAMECPGAGSAGTKTAGFQLLENSTIVFKNGKIECTDANKEKTWESGSTSKGIALMIQNYANLTLEDITIDATNIAHNGAAVRYALSNNSGNVEYKGNTTIITESGDYAFDVCKYDSYAYPTVTWNSTGTVTGGIELTGGEFIVAKDLNLSRPIRSNSNPAILTVNSGVTVSPAQKFGTVKTAFADSFNEASSGVVIVNRGGNLTIKGEGTITTTAEAHCYAAVCLTEKGEDTGADAKLTVEGNVTLEGYYYGIAGNGSRQGTDITINSGTVKGIEENNCSGIYHPQNGKLAINGGTIEGATGIYVKSGEVTTVNGGTIRGLGDKTTFEHNNSGAKVTGDAFIVENCGYPGGTPVVAISGGTFESVHASAVSSYGYQEHPALTGFISGGLYNTEPDADCIVAGKKAEQNAQGYWEIVMDELAIVNGVKYATVGEAIDAANTGEVINVYGTTNFTKADDGFCYTDASNKKGRLVLVELVNAGSPTTNASLKVNTAPSINSMTFQTLWLGSESRLEAPGSYLKSGDVLVLPAKTMYLNHAGSAIHDVYGDITFLGKKGKTVIQPIIIGSSSSYRFFRLYNRYVKNITDGAIYHYNFKDVTFDGSHETHASANLFVVTCYNIQINMDGCTVTNFPGSVFSIWANDTLTDGSYPTKEDNVGVEVNITNSTLTGNGRLVHYDCSPYQSRDIDAGYDRYAFIHVNYDNSCTVNNTEQYSINVNTAKGKGNCLLNGVDVWPAEN